MQSVFLKQHICMLHAKVDLRLFYDWILSGVAFAVLDLAPFARDHLGSNPLFKKRLRFGRQT